METTSPKPSVAPYNWDSVQFAGVCFSAVFVDPRSGEVQMPADITALLHKRFNRRELDAIAAECTRSIIAKDSPVCFAEGMPQQPFAMFLREQVNRVLAGGPREV